MLNSLFDKQERAPNRGSTKSVQSAAVMLSAAFLFFPWFGRSKTLRVPLCPLVAAKSYSPSQPTAVINKYAAEQAQLRKIKIRALSPFVGEISGRKDRVKAFAKNYPFMLCAFDPAQEVQDQSVYMVCIQNAPEWLQIVRSQTPADLMLDRTHFAAVCVQ